MGIKPPSRVYLKFLRPELCVSQLEEAHFNPSKWLYLKRVPRRQHRVGSCILSSPPSPVFQLVRLDHFYLTICEGLSVPFDFLFSVCSLWRNTFESSQKLSLGGPQDGIKKVEFQLSSLRGGALSHFYGLDLTKNLSIVKQVIFRLLGKFCMGEGTVIFNLLY